MRVLNTVHIITQCMVSGIVRGKASQPAHLQDTSIREMPAWIYTHWLMRDRGKRCDIPYTEEPFS